MVMSPTERSQRARIAGLTRALRDPDNLAAARARAGLVESFHRRALEQCGPLASEAQVASTAATLRRLHYAKLSGCGVAARQGRAR